LTESEENAFGCEPTVRMMGTVGATFKGTWTGITRSCYKDKIVNIKGGRKLSNRAICPKEF
jgi:hypothetical protein